MTLKATQEFHVRNGKGKAWRTCLLMVERRGLNDNKISLAL